MRRIIQTTRHVGARAGRHACAFLDSVAEHWLGYARPPPRRVMAAAGWQPDRRGAYCPRCGESVGAGEVTGGGCGACRGLAVHADGIVRLGFYGGPLREWVLAVKYQPWAGMGLLLGHELGRAVSEAACLDDLEHHAAVVVPVPTPWLRSTHRRIDHTRVIAAGVADELGLPMRQVLARWRGPPQVSLRADERRRRSGIGITGSIRSRLCPPRPRQVILVDDVRTTGSTVRGATKAVRAAIGRPVRVVVAVVATADTPGRRRAGSSTAAEDPADHEPDRSRGGESGRPAPPDPGAGSAAGSGLAAHRSPPGGGAK